MANKGYTNRTEVENYLLITIDESFHDQVDRWIGEVELYIDRMTERNFVADESPSEKLFDGDGSNNLILGDFLGIDDVSIDGDTITDPDSDAEQPYLLYPANTTPKTKLVLRASRFPAGLQNISVTGTWGYSAECPVDITTVATVLVAGIINYSNNSEGEVQSESIGRYTVTYKTEKQWQDFERVKDILNYYTKQTL